MDTLTRTTWLKVFALVCVVIIMIDVYTGSTALGAAWRFMVVLLEQAWRFTIVLWERMIAFSGVIATGRVMKALTALTMGVGLGYLLSGPTAARWYQLRNRLRQHGAYVRKKWHELHFLGKCLVVAGLIVVQVYEDFWVLLFPVGFMVPALVFAYARAKRFIINYAFGNWYRERYGARQSRIIKTLTHNTKARKVIQPLRFTELLFRCGWRLWRFDPAYRDAHGNRLEFRGRIKLIRAFLAGEWYRYLQNHHLLGWGRPSPEKNEATK